MVKKKEPGVPKSRKGTQKKPLMLKADLHMHTARSGDSDISAWDIIEQARAEQLDIVGVTDHNTTRGGIETKALAAKEFPELIVLVGQEVMTKSGEIIVFGPEETLPKRRPLTDTCKKARQLGGFIVVPHPFDRMRHGIGKNIKSIMEYIDAVEVLNSKSIWQRLNRRARMFAEAHRLPMVAGSDAHIPQYIGSCYTMIDTGKQRPTDKEIYAAIKAGKTVPSGNVVGLRGAGIRARMRKLVKKIRKHP